MMNFDKLLADTLTLLPLFIIVVTGLVQMILAVSKKPIVNPVLVSLVGYVAAAIFLAGISSSADPLFNGFVQIGPVGLTGAWVILVISILHTMLSSSINNEQIPKADYLALQAFAVSGMLMLVWSGDLITLFIGLETMSIPFYVMAGINRTDVRSNESGMKYFLIGAFAAGFFLYGIALLYGATGKTNLTEISTFLSLSQTPPLVWVGIGLMAVGFFFKVSAVPFHFWAPDVYQGAPTVSGSFLATAGKTASFTALMILTMKVIPANGSNWSGILAIVAGLSMIIGNLTALPQSNLKRILGYSSVAHAGYILLGFLSGTTGGYQAIVFYVGIYAVTSFTAFAAISTMENSEKGLSIDSVRGFGFSRPLEAAILSVALLSLLGLPPFGGFIGKYLIFIDAYKAGYLPLVILAVIASIVSAGYYLRVVISMYQPAGLETQPQQWNMATGSIIAAVVIIILTGIYPLWPSDLIISAW